VHEAIHDKFVAALTEKINALKAPFPLPLSFVETLLTERVRCVRRVRCAGVCGGV
jgi:hypothetical protein